MKQQSRKARMRSRAERRKDLADACLKMRIDVTLTFPSTDEKLAAECKSLDVLVQKPRTETHAFRREILRQIRDNSRLRRQESQNRQGRQSGGRLAVFAYRRYG